MDWLRSVTTMAQLNYLRSPMFWNTKVRIAIMTLVTFAALC